jgi:hypothetical protein
MELMVTPTTLSAPSTTIQCRPRGENYGGEWWQRWKHHPAFDFLAPSKESADGAEMTEEDTRRNIGND